MSWKTKNSQFLGNVHFRMEISSVLNRADFSEDQKKVAFTKALSCGRPLVKRASLLSPWGLKVSDQLALQARSIGRNKKKLAQVLVPYIYSDLSPSLRIRHNAELERRSLQWVEIETHMDIFTAESLTYEWWRAQFVSHLESALKSSRGRTLFFGGLRI